MKQIRFIIAQLLVSGIDLPPLIKSQSLNIFFSFVLYGGGPIVLGYLSGHLFWGIGIAVFVVFSIYRTAFIGLIKGAEYALRNPPKVGESTVKFTVDDQDVWESKKFTFEPPQPGSNETSLEIKMDPIKLPTKPLVLKQWKVTWKLIKGPWNTNPSYKYISDWLEKTHKDLPSSTDTLRKIIEAGEKGLLED